MKKTLSILACGSFLLPSIAVFADGEAAATSQGSMMQTLVMIGVAVAFFYFILLRPEQKRRKQMEKLRTSLKKGDKITAMGIVGSVVKIQDTTVVISLYDGAKMEILKAAITHVEQGSDEKIEKVIEVTDSR